MINWLYQSAIDITVLIIVVLILRIPVRKYLGAKAAYWLWIVPLIRLLIWHKAEVPIAILEKVHLPNQEILFRVFNNPEHYVLPFSVSLEMIWGAGLLLWVMMRIVALLKFRSILKSTSVQINIAEVVPAIRGLANYLADYRKVQFYMTSIPQAPFVTGLFVPKVYLPQGQFGSYPGIQQICILKHELTHVSRKDLWLQVVAEIIRSIMWFNPVVHVAWSKFREDQELACDHDVLATSNSNERYEYGRALLNGLHAHALPATMAFLNNHKQRFILLEKHKRSKMNNIIGAIICSVLLFFSIAKAPKSIAADVDKSFKKGHVSFKFYDIPLRDMLLLLMEVSKKNIQGINNIPDVKVSLEAHNVSALQLEALVIKCSGLSLIHKGESYELVKSSNQQANKQEMSECVESFGE